MEPATNIRTLPSLLERIAGVIAEAKATEQEANARRIEAERELLALVGEMDAEGTTKVDAGLYAVTIRCSLNRTIDKDALTRIADRIPEAIGKRLIRWKPEVDLRELRYLQSNEPDMYGIASEAIVTKAAKPSVSVERKEG